MMKERWKKREWEAYHDPNARFEDLTANAISKKKSEELVD